MINRNSMYRYRATGRGLFPFDMLRHDQCYPVDGMNAMNYDEYSPREPRSAVLLGRVRPTVGRWLSFGWSVDPDSIEVLE